MGEKVDADWIWRWLMDYCREHNIAPATKDDLFKMVTDARKLEDR